MRRSPDPMIDTILRQSPGDGRGAVAAWRQLTDILAQRGNSLSQADVHRALRALALLRPRVDEKARRDTALAVARHGRFAPLVAFYSHDVPTVSVVMLRKARLDERDWLALLPTTSALARSVLAGREDLPLDVRRALASLGAGAMALPAAAQSDHGAQPAEATPASGSASQISELVRRIDKFKSSRALTNHDPARSAGEATRFQFETGPDGMIVWVDGVERGAVIGLSIAQAAFGDEPGVDGGAAGAFRQRGEIVSARLQLQGGGKEAGDWRIAARPRFDPGTGQFLGYRGSARRPLSNERPYGRSSEEESGDSIRQLIHELRSPLNAISGFAQIIAGQMFGPVSGTYRAMAESVIADAASIQEIIDDLHLATRHETAPPTTEEQPIEAVDIAAVTQKVEDDLAPLLAEQGVRLSLSRIGGPFLAHVGEDDARRMIGRMVTALVDICEPETNLVGQLLLHEPEESMLHLRIVRPAAIRFASAEELLDPGFSPEGEAPGAAILSLGFSLRLVDRLARAAGGALEIGHNALTLRLRSATSRSRADDESSPDLQRNE